jgi:hypothetical protein
MRELKSPPPTAEPWIVWDISQPTNFCTVIARTWILACQEGRVRLGCEKVDAGLESDKPLEKIHRIDTCILCNMSPCICIRSTPPPAPQECHQNLYTSFLTTPDLKLKAVYRDKILALIFKKLFDL